jgi:hypothetical protein
MKRVHDDLYAAFANRVGEPPQHVTMQGHMFFANKGLLELLVERMKLVHPGVVFAIEKVEEK